jgi:hypothetical protein
VAVHAFAHAGFTGLGDQFWHVVLSNEIVQVMIRLKNDAPATPAVAAARAAFGNVGFTMERHAAFAAVPRTGEDFDFVYEHLLRLLILLALLFLIHHSSD